MPIDLTGTETEFQSVLRRFLEETVSLDALRSDDTRKPDPSLWSGLVDLGIFEVFADQDNELSCRECCLLLQEFAAHCVPEPASEQLVYGSFLNGIAARLRQEQAEWIPADRLSALTSGVQPVTLVYGAASGSLQKNAFSGELALVPLSSTEHSFCLASIDGEQVLLDLSTGSVSVSPVDAVDITRRFGSLSCTGVTIYRLPEGLAAVVPVLRDLLIAHEITGMCKAVQKLSLDHANTRQQFGTAIGSFQAVQHTLADMYLWLEAIDSTALFAAWAFDDSDEQREFAAAAAARVALEKGMFFLERAIQVHGGIGFTWEYDIHLYLRRVLFFQALCGPRPGDDSRLLALARKL